MEKLFGEFSGRQGRAQAAGTTPLPLVVAIHGGSYTSAYFDVPGSSLLDRATANGIPIIALDRPGYGDTPILDDAGIWGQARFLTEALGEAWRVHGQGTRGIVLVGHSIGGAIAATVASEAEGLPLLGVAVSGVGLRTPPAFGPMWGSLPETPHVELPAAVKNQVMFGPEGSFDPAMQAASHDANAPAVRAELIHIVGDWQHRVHDILGRIAVPFHYRQAEDDRLWVVDEGEVQGFARALTRSPRVDAAMMRATGHCMDFHYVGAALQLQQLGFALQCASEAG